MIKLHKFRCPWAEVDNAYKKYHDEELAQPIWDAYNGFLENNSLEETLKIFLGEIKELMDFLPIKPSFFPKFFWPSNPLKELLENAITRALKIKVVFSSRNNNPR